MNTMRMDSDPFAEIEVHDTDTMPEQPADLDLWIERRMWAARQLLAEQKRNQAQADELTAPLRARIQMVEAWAADENAKLQRQVDWLTQQIEQAVLAYPFDGKAKSRKMPAGTFGRRISPEKLDIEDRDAAVAFAKAHDVPVRVKEEPDARALREWFDSTGTVPDGCRHIPAVEKPFVKITEEG